jgi:hypothetical protein
MLIYNYTTKNDESKQIKITLASTSFIEKWVQYLKSLSVKCNQIEWYIAKLNDSTQIREPWENVYDLLKLRDSFMFINKHRMMHLSVVIEAIERLIESPQKVTQRHLNEWHRLFTIMEMRFLKNEEPVPEHVDKQEMFQSIQDVNFYTHNLEAWTYNKSAKRNHLNHNGVTRQYSIQFTNATNLNYTKAHNAVFSENNIELIHDEKFDFLTESFDYNVWLHEDITGKDQIKAWLDDDDLKHFDITGNLLMTPSITLDPKYLYKNVLSHPFFEKESKACNKTLDRYPIGNIVDLDNIDWDEFAVSKIDSIVLDDIKLWG